MLFGNDKNKKIIALVFCFTIVISSFLGVTAAKKLSMTSFGAKLGELTSTDKYNPSYGLLNILLLGIDESGALCDTIMLFSIDQYSSEVNLLSVPRDTRVMVGSSHVKINSTLGIGKQEVSRGRINEPEDYVISKVKEVTGMPIHYFVSVNLQGFKDVIDALGGVDYDVPYDMNYDDPTQNLHIHLQAGYQHLDGQAAHDYVRYRHDTNGRSPGNYVKGDEGRIEAQQNFIKEVISQKLTGASVAHITELYKILNKYVRTNFTGADLAKYTSLITTIRPEKITTYQLPGEAQYIGGVSYYIYDPAAAQELVDTVFQPRSAADYDIVNDRPIGEGEPDASTEPTDAVE